MNRQIMLARRDARTRAGALAGNLGCDIKRLLDGEAAMASAASPLYLRDVGLVFQARVSPTPGRAEAKRALARHRRRVRATATDLERSLSFGLGFDFAPDADLGLMRGHARNLALVISRNVQAAADPGLESVPHAQQLLLQAGRFAQELVATIESIQRRVLEIEATTLNDPWSATWAGRLLAVAARLLPPERRRDFIEDQCGNLEMVESRREWACYMLGLLAQMPDVALAAIAGSDQDYRRT
ncbi:MAG TPA: hypothetical protein VKI99_10640 [Candidatus Dormibacteraeota bacterium]|nr:hypothetical protein [Candidatus Dormibacteraeota bacterium]